MAWLMVCASVVAVLGRPACAVEKASPLVIGETFTIDSKLLGEPRRINVYLPPGYAEALQARFPVLYMPDGGVGEDFLYVAGLVQVSVGSGTMRPFVPGLRRRVDQRLRDILLEDPWDFGVEVLQVTGDPRERVRRVLAYLASTDPAVR